MNHAAQVVAPIRRLKTMATLALFVLALLAAVRLEVNQAQLAIARDDSRLLNVAGRQLMLGQELCKAALILRWNTDPFMRTQALEELRATLVQLERGHAALLLRDHAFGLRGESSPETRKLFAKLDPDFKAIVEMAKGFVLSPDGTGSSRFLEGLLDHERKFLAGMEQLVSRYGEEANERDNSQKWARRTLFGVALLLILLVGVVFVFRPIESLTRAHDRLAAQYTTAQVLAESTSLAEAAPKLVHAISENLNWALCSLWILDQTTDQLGRVEEWHAPAWHRGTFERLAVRVRTAGQPVWIPNMAKESTFGGGITAGIAGPGGGLGVPITLGSEMVGVLEFFSPHVRFRDEAMLRTLTLIGSQIGQFIARTRTEEALRSSVGRFRQFADNVDEVFWITDPGRTEIVYLSPAYETIWGRTCASLYADPDSWVDAIHPEDLERIVAAWGRVAHGEYHEEFRIIRPDGSIRWIEDRGVQILNEAGEAYRVCGTAQDITRRKEAERELRASEERFRQLAENVHEVFWISDPENTEILYVSPAYETIWGRTCESLYANSRSWLESIHPDDRELVFGSLNKQTLGDYNLEHRIVHLDGSIHWVWVRVFPVRDDAGQVYRLIGIAQDITGRKNSEESLRAKIEAEKANRAKSEFLSRMSHELRTPLNAILGFGQLLDLADLAVDDRESVDQITTAGRHLLQLVNELLDISRIEEGAMTLSREPVHVGDALDAAMELIEPLAAQRRIRITSQLPLNCEWHILADEQRLRQVLLNLLSNSVKYNRDGGTVMATVKQCAGDKLRIEISDTGYGIAGHNIPKLFQPFERLEAAQSHIEGAGLGLALSKRLVEAMGGIVGAESVKDEGSTFWIELPLVDSPVERVEHSGDANPRLAIAEPYGEPSTVLYIEDNLSNLQLLQRAFHYRPELSLLTAVNGREGLQLARDRKPVLILLDLHLPDITGEAVLNTLRQDPSTSSIPVVVISADATPSSIARLLSAGAHDYVTKPLQIKGLLNLLDAVMTKETAVDVT